MTKISSLDDQNKTNPWSNRFKNHVKSLDGNPLSMNEDEQYIWDHFADIYKNDSKDSARPQTKQQFKDARSDLAQIQFFALLKNQDDNRLLSSNPIKWRKSLTQFTAELLRSLPGLIQNAKDQVTNSENMQQQMSPNTNPAEIVKNASLQNQAGQTIALSSHFNQPGQDAVVVMFSASWCPPCQAKIPYVNQAMRELPNVHFVSINVEPQNEYLRAMKKKTKGDQPEYPVLFDPESEVYSKMNTTGIPYMMIFTNDGTLLADHTGFAAVQNGQPNPVLEEIKTVLERN